jgi:hypothetical protein
VKEDERVAVGADALVSVGQLLTTIRQLDFFYSQAHAAIKIAVMHTKLARYLAHEANGN